MQIKELDFKIIKLITSDARYDIMNYFISHIAATVAILLQKVELTDQSVRNFLKQLENVNFIQGDKYKVRGGRLVVIYHLLNQDFNLSSVVSAHLATRKKRERLYDYTILFILDVPFKRYLDVNRKLHLTNEKLNLQFACSVGEVDGMMGSNIIRIQHGQRSNEDKLIMEVKRELRKIQKTNPTVLEQFLVYDQNSGKKLDRN